MIPELYIQVYNVKNMKATAIKHKDLIGPWMGATLLYNAVTVPNAIVSLRKGMVR